jgi:hypothetical protein
LSLQNLQNKGVVFKIFQGKELCATFRLCQQFPAKSGMKTSETIVRQSQKIIRKHLPCGGRAARMKSVNSQVPKCEFPRGLKATAPSVDATFKKAPRSRPAAAQTMELPLTPGE